MYTVEEILKYDFKLENEYSTELGVFDNFYKPFINFFRLELKSKLDKYEFCTNSKESLIDDLSLDLAANLVSIAARTLIYDFNESHINVYDIPGDYEYKQKNEHFKSNKNIDLLLEKYPVLKNIIELQIKYKLNLISDVLERLHNDKYEIKNNFGIDIQVLNKLSLGEGDVHNNGQSVVQIHLNENDKLIYKPRSLKIDILYNKLLEWINTHFEFQKLFIIKNLDKDEYGWQECVNFNESKTKADVEYYFYGTGQLLALLYLLNSSDMHHENIISNGKYPVLIDLETLVTNRSNLETSGVSKYICDSVISTLMLPTRFPSKLFDVDLSGIGGVHNKESDKIKGFILDNQFKNNVSISSVKASIEPKLNRVILNGKVMYPQNFLYKIESGFKDTCKLIQGKKEEFLHIIKNLKFVEIRQVLKPTMLYSRYLEASLHPKYLNNYKNYNMVFDILKNNKKGKESMLIESEIDILKVRNIPYFYTRIDSKNIYYQNSNGNTDSIDNYYEDSIYNAVIDKVEKLNDVKIENQLRIMRLSFVQENTQKYNSNNKLEYSLQYKNVIDSIISRIEMYTFEEEDKSYLIDMTLNNNLYMGSINSSLYEGGSIILLLNYYAHYTNNHEMRKLADRLLEGTKITSPKLEKEIITAYSGVGSLIYIYYNLYKIWGDNKHFDAYRRHLKKLKDKVASNDIVILSEYLNGVSSLIVVLSNIYKEDKIDDIRDLILTLLNKLDESESKQIIKNSGLAHGYSGLALGYIIGGQAISNERFINIGIDVMLKENTLYQNNIGNWLDIRENKDFDSVYWCYGATGIGISRHLIKDIRSIEFIYNDLENAICKVKNNGILDIKNDSVCHGFFGNIDMLNTVNKLDKEIYSIINNRLSKINLNKFQDGYNGNGDILNVFIGLGGIAYTLLRLLNKNYPSVLTLDIYGGNE